MGLMDLHKEGQTQLIYICSPCNAPTPAGVTINMEAANEYCNVAYVETRIKAIAPHAWLPQILDDRVPEERALAIEIGTDILKKCSAIFVCGDRLSAGMAGEVKLAVSLDIPVYVFNKALGETVRLCAGEKEVTAYAFSGNPQSCGIAQLAIRPEEVVEWIPKQIQA